MNLLKKTYSASLFDLTSAVSLAEIYYTLSDVVPLEVRDHGESWSVVENKTSYIEDVDFLYLSLKYKEVIIKDSDLRKLKKKKFEEYMATRGLPKNWWRKRQYRDLKAEAEGECYTFALKTFPIRERFLQIALSESGQYLLSSEANNELLFSFLSYLCNHLEFDVKIRPVTFCDYQEEYQNYNIKESLIAIFSKVVDSPVYEENHIKVVIRNKNDELSKESRSYSGRCKDLDSNFIESVQDESHYVSELSLDPQVFEEDLRCYKISLYYKSLGVMAFKDGLYPDRDHDGFFSYVDLNDRVKIMREAFTFLKEKMQ